MVISGVYNQNMQLVTQTINDIWKEFNISTLEVSRPEIVNILKQRELLSDSTFVKRILIKDESGTNRILIGFQEGGF